MTVADNYDNSVMKKQNAINCIKFWMGINHLFNNNQVIPHTNIAKYLGIILDAKLLAISNIFKCYPISIC